VRTKQILRWFALSAFVSTAACGGSERDIDDAGGSDARSAEAGSADGNVADGPRLCFDDLSPCLGLCVDLQNDPSFCGSCDVRCAGDQHCDNGVCTASCIGGLVFCEEGACEGYGS